MLTTCSIQKNRLENQIEDLQEQIFNCDREKSDLRNAYNENEAILKEIKEENEVQIARLNFIELERQQLLEQHKQERLGYEERIAELMADFDISEENACTSHPVRDSFLRVRNETVRANNAIRPN